MVNILLIVDTLIHYIELHTHSFTYSNIHVFPSGWLKQFYIYFHHDYLTTMSVCYIQAPRKNTLDVSLCYELHCNTQQHYTYATLNNPLLFATVYYFCDYLHHVSDCISTIAATLINKAHRTDHYKALKVHNHLHVLYSNLQLYPTVNSPTNFLDRASLSECTGSYHIPE